MKFFPIPDPTKRVVTPELLEVLQSANIIPHNIGAFASNEHFIEAVGTQPPQEGFGRKLWRDNSAIWQPNKTEFSYTMILRNGTGNFAGIDLRMKGDRLGFSDLAFEIYSAGTARFYQEYIQHFPIVPMLRTIEMNRADAMRLNFTSGDQVAYPLNLPSNMALRFNPNTGEAEAFYWEEYVKQFKPGAVPNNQLSDYELVSAIAGISGSGMTVKEKAAAIRSFVGR